jgi:hypothetical protein
MTPRRALYWAFLAAFLVMVAMMWAATAAGWAPSTRTIASGLAGASLAGLLLAEGKYRFTFTGKLMLVGGVAVAILAVLSLISGS